MGQFNTGFENSYTPVQPGGGAIPAFGGTGGSVGPTPGASYGPAQGPSANPAAGAAGFNNPSAPATPPATPPSSNAFGTSGWKPSFESNLGGYNPSQYASLETSNQLAQALGANVSQTKMGPGSPFNVPNQNSLSFGTDSNLNAGLVAERYAKYGKEAADRMTRDELAMQSKAQAPNADSMGGEYGSWSQFQAKPGGVQALGQGANLGSSVGGNSDWRGPQGGGPQMMTPNPQRDIQPQPFQQGGGGMGGNWHPPGPISMAPQASPHQFPRPQQPSYGNRNNFGGFGGANNFQNANQGSQIQQLLQMLMGGQGGTMQSRGRQSPFQSGTMSGMAGMLNGMQNGGQAFNPMSQGMNYGSGQGLMGYYPRYR